MSDVKPNMEDQTDLPDYEEQELATTEVAPAAQKFVFFMHCFGSFTFFCKLTLFSNFCTGTRTSQCTAQGGRTSC